jgi:hypothetical protein
MQRRVLYIPAAKNFLHKMRRATCKVPIFRGGMGELLLEDASAKDLLSLKASQQ